MYTETPHQSGARLRDFTSGKTATAQRMGGNASMGLGALLTVTPASIADMTTVYYALTAPSGGVPIESSPVCAALVAMACVVFGLKTN